MPVRSVWGTDHPTVCQNCATAADSACWWNRAIQAINSGHYHGLEGEAVYSASHGAFV